MPTKARKKVQCQRVKVQPFWIRRLCSITILIWPNIERCLMRNICGRSYSGCHTSSKMVNFASGFCHQNGVTVRFRFGIVPPGTVLFYFLYFFDIILTSSSTIRGSFPRSRRRSLGGMSTVADPVFARPQIRSARPGCP